MIMSQIQMLIMIIMCMLITTRGLAVGLEGLRSNYGGKMEQLERSLLSRVNNNVTEMKVGLILDENDWVGLVGYSCIQMAISDFYAANPHFKTRLVLSVRDQKKLDVVSAAAAAFHLINDDEVKAIIGPLTSTETNFVISLGTKAQVPIISYSATSPMLSALGSPYFIRATQNDAVQVQAIGALIQAFGWKEVVPIYGNNEYGEGIMRYMVDMLQGINTQIPYQSAISTNATDDQISKEMYKLKTMQTRVFIVHLWPTIGSRVFLKAKEAGMMNEDYVWISTNGIGNLLESLDDRVVESMQGALVVRTYVPKTQEHENFTLRWSKKFRLDHPNMVGTKLNVYGLWAYDSTLALAKAMEEVGPSLDSGFSKMINTSSSNSTNLDDIRVSKVGPKLLNAILETRFNGISGNFSLSMGELQPSTFQIVNMFGNGWKEVGFWTPNKGLMKDLNSKGRKGYSTSKDDLRPIIWPGDSFSIPRGWVIPATGKKLRIGVPVRPGFKEFVKVTKNPKTNNTEVIGFCIDVFDATMEKLPYYVPYEYVPFEKEDGSARGSYNDLVYQVYLGNYDAVVGDVTIIANRSQYVDFTQPYTQSGVTMVVPYKESKAGRAWLFLKPLTWDLWFITFCFFVFIAFVLWVLEHRVNEDFRGPPLHQAGTTLYYSFSTIVFAHNGNLFNNLARFIMVVWTFVVFILTQSYTASLTSMLTVEQLHPVVQDVSEMIKRGEYVGYQQGSFMFGRLKELGFQESRLKSYKDSEELDQLLSKGSKNGGIAAVFDELPYMMLFVSKFCDKYTMVKPTYKTGGFGFVFPKGSPMVSDVSRAILNVTEGDKMVMLENLWIKQQDLCSNSSKLEVSYNSLGLESFWGLFLIAGLTAFFALGIFIATFMRRHWSILRQPNTTIKTKLRKLVDVFDDRDLSSHTFRRKQEMSDTSVRDCHRRDDVPESMANTHCPPSSNDTERCPSGFSSAQASPSHGYFHDQI